MNFHLSDQDLDALMLMCACHDTPHARARPHTCARARRCDGDASGSIELDELVFALRMHQVGPARAGRVLVGLAAAATHDERLQRGAT